MKAKKNNMILIKDTYFDNEITDVLVTEKDIYKVRRGADGADTVIDGTDTIALRGTVDVHAHFRYPGLSYKEDLYSGYRAAVSGGFAAVCCEPNTYPVIDCTDVLNKFYETAKDISPLLLSKAAVTVGEEGEILTFFKALQHGGAVMFSDDGEPIVNEDLLVEAFKKTVALSVTHPPVITAHCEETPKSMSRVREIVGNGFEKYDAEVEIIRLNIRALYRAKNGRLHIQHVSKKESLEIIREAKNAGLKVTAEVTPHHLLFSTEDFQKTDTAFKINPPLRAKEDMLSMRKGLEDGTIDMVATDHAPHSISEKMQSWEKAPFGATSIQTAISAVYGLVASGELSRDRFIQAFTDAPQQLLPADIRATVNNTLTLLNTKEKWQLGLNNNYSHSMNTPFWHKPMIAKPVAVIIGGKFYMKDGNVLF